MLAREMLRDFNPDWKDKQESQNVHPEMNKKKIFPKAKRKLQHLCDTPNPAVSFWTAGKFMLYAEFIHIQKNNTL